MSRYEDENRALLLLKKLDGQTVQLDASAPELAGETGQFEILEDMNCCAPTDQILVAFEMDRSRRVMDAAAFLQLAEHIAPVEEQKDPEKQPAKIA